MPGPSSVTLSTTLPASGPGSVSATVTVVPGGVWLPALLIRLASTWRSRCSSPRTMTGSSGIASPSLAAWSR